MAGPKRLDGHKRRLDGHKVLVTGGAVRIGRTLALSLAEAGAAVAITYRSSQEDAERTLGELRALGGRAEAIYCELTDEASIERAVEQAVGSLGGLTTVVNNAGAFETLPPETITAEQWDAMFAANARAPFLVSQAVLPHLREHARTGGAGAVGRIINIGSLGGLRAWATHAHYCASKAALHMLTLSLAKAFAPEVAVNCVAPGMIVTSAPEVEVAGEYAHFVGKTPMKRNGTPADVAEAVVFLAGATGFITGQVLTVDGGLGL